MISTKSVEAAQQQLRTERDELHAELQHGAIRLAALDIADGIIAKLLAPDPVETEAAPVRKPRRITDESRKPVAKPVSNGTAEPKSRRTRVTGNEARNAEVVRLKESGMSANDIAKRVKMSVPGVYGILKRHKEGQTASEGDDAEDGPADPPAAEQPPRKTKPPVQIESYADDLPSELTPTEMQMAVNRVEKLLGVAKKLTAEQICASCKLKPAVFAQVAKLAKIALVDGVYVMTRRF